MRPEGEESRRRRARRAGETGGGSSPGSAGAWSRRERFCRWFCWARLACGFEGLRGSWPAG